MGNFNYSAAFASFALIVTVAFNIAAVCTEKWYDMLFKDFEDGHVYWGLLSIQSCNGWCQVWKYTDLQLPDDQVDDLHRTKIGGYLAMSILIANIVLSSFLLFTILVFHIPELFDLLPKLSKSFLYGKEKFFPLVIIPLQLAAVACWAGLFGFYHSLDEYINGVTIANSIILMVCSVGVCLITSVITTQFIKQQQQYELVPTLQ